MFIAILGFKWNKGGFFKLGKPQVVKQRKVGRGRRKNINLFKSLKWKVKRGGQKKKVGLRRRGRGRGRPVKKGRGFLKRFGGKMYY